MMNLQMNNMQNMKNMKNMQNMNNMQNINNMNNINNMQNMNNMQNIKTFQNIDNMQNFQNNQNQYINLNESYLEDLLRPYKEKIDKLERELKEKQKEIDKLKLKIFKNNVTNKNKQQFMNNIGNQINNQVINSQFNNMSQINNNMNPMDMMNNMGIQMNKMNNNINLMNNLMNQNNMMNMPIISNNNNLINNPMFQMCNLMNANNNTFQIMQAGNNINKEEVKNLSVTFRMNKVAPVMIQCQSKDKMKETIDKYCAKALLKNKEEYNFIFNAKKVILSDTVGENGITNNSNIFIVKKSQDEIAKEKENKKNNHNINNNSSILEEGWTLFFVNPNIYGSKISIKINEQKLVKEALDKFFQSLDISNSTQKRMKFIFNNKELFPDMLICQSGLSNNSEILVIEIQNIIGA